MLPAFNPPTGDYLMIPGLLIAAVALGAVGILATRKRDGGKRGAHSADVARRDGDREGGGGAA